jgi:parallel beta-helix repeat protein
MRFINVLLTVVCLGGAMGSGAALSAGSTITLAPSGVDDTSNIQAALDACEPGCTVQLEAGTFHTAQLVASNFRGVLRGRGRGLTVLEALPTLPVNDALPWPWAVSPTPAEPWPVLLAFLDGRFVVSDLTVRVPRSPATEPWLIGAQTLRELIAIMVTGDRAHASFQRVDVEGAPGTYFGRNIIFGIAYEGILAVVPGQATVQPQRPITGSFSMTHCAMRFVSLGTLLYHVRDTVANVTHNTVESVDIGYLLNEAAGTNAEFAHNSGDVQDTAVAWFQGLTLDYAGPSRLVVTHNSFEVREGGIRGTGDGIDLRDGGQTKTATAVVIDNQFTLQTATTPVPLPLRGGIFVTGLRGALIQGNHVLGPGPAGISLGGAVSGIVRDNHVRGAAQVGIAVLSASAGNTISRNHVRESGAVDLQWDGTGVGNTFGGNHCATSDPAGLCSKP